MSAAIHGAPAPQPLARVALICCMLLCTAQQTVFAQTPAPPSKPSDKPTSTRPSTIQGSLHERAIQSLARNPRGLPLSEEGHWLKWGPKDSIASELQGDVTAATRAYMAQDYGASLAYIYAVLDREHDFPPALYQGGLCYFRLRRYGDAAAMLERFVNVAPQEIAATQALGHCYYSLGDYQRARTHYERVLGPSQSSPEALRGLALCELHLENPKRALELLSKVLELRPDHADAHAWCAQILFDAGDTKSALVHAERARDLEPWEPRPWYLLARMYGELDRQDDAEKAHTRFETASRIEQQLRQQEGLLLHDPARADVWKELIALQRTGGNRQAVREALPHLAGVAPAEPQMALFLVDAYEWLGEKDRALSAARKAESVAGSDKKTWMWLADFYRREADVEGAQRAQRAADASH